MLRELNSEIDSHIDDTATQTELRQIKDLLLLKINSLEILVATSNLIEEAEVKPLGRTATIEEGSDDE